MMANSQDDEILIGLTRVTNEFFDARTSNARKREIEAQLELFGNEKDAWKTCLYSFTNTNTPYVRMYCLQVIEKIVNKRWMGVDSNVKSQLRMNLSQILLMHYRNLEPFISNKLMKVIVNIARNDWPMFYCDYFDGILQLAASHQNQNAGEARLIGLHMLRMTSEEFMTSSRDDISVTRKVELRQLMLQQIRNVFQVCNSVLEQEWSSCMVERRRDHATMMATVITSGATPPPSPPNHGSGKLKSCNLFDLFTPHHQNTTVVVNSLPSTSSQAVVAALDCLAHYFSWAPLSDDIGEELIASVFRFAQLGVVHLTITNPNLTNREDGVKGEVEKMMNGAMVVINEIVSKNCIPPSFEQTLIGIFQNMFSIIQEVTEGRRETVDDGYMKNLIRFLSLFINQHFTRIEANENFPLTLFLHELIKFTFTPFEDHEDYKQCLELWEVLIDFIEDKMRNSATSDPNIKIHPEMKRYAESLTLFGSTILRHIQFVHNSQYLSNIDHETPDDNGKTDWENYLVKNVEVVASLTSLNPIHMINKMYETLEQAKTVLSLPNLLTMGELESQHAVKSLRDLATTIQTLGRISEVFLTHFHDSCEKCGELVENLLNISDYCASLPIHLSTSHVNQHLKSSLEQVHVQILATLQPYTHWLAQLYSEAQQAGHSQQQLLDLLTGYVDSILPVFSDKYVGDKIKLAAAHTFSSVISNVRATFLLQIPKMEEFYRSFLNSPSHLNLHPDTQQVINRSLSNLLVLPWPNTPECEQKWEERERSHQALVASLLAPFLRICADLSKFADLSFAASAKPVVEQAVKTMRGLSETLRAESNKSREICCNSLRRYIDLTFALLDLYIQHSPETCEMVMSFYLVLFTSMRRQLGADYLASTIKKFLHLFTTQLLQTNLLHHNSSGAAVVNLFIKIVEIVVDETGHSFKFFTQDIISLAVNQLFPIVKQKQDLPDITSSLYGLLHRILSRRHRYFFPSPVLQNLLQADSSSSSSSTSNSSHQEQRSSYTISHKQQFVAIMEAFGHSFMQPDITVFRENLYLLKDLNMKQKLFDKIHGSLFSEGILFQFVFCLIRALINKGHDLLIDDICGVVHEMCLVDFNYFHSNLLRQFLENMSELTSDQKSTLYTNFSSEQDLPTFNNNLMRFVNDMRYYRLCNSSLPRGTVHF